MESIEDLIQKGILPPREVFDRLARIPIDEPDMSYASGKAPVPRKITEEEFNNLTRRTVEYYSTLKIK